MSLFISGKTRCAVCDRVMTSQDRTISFPAFCWNEADPLWRFNDATAHFDCFSAHPLAVATTAAVNELEWKSGPERRKCAVCRSEIVEPDDWLQLPRFGSDSADPLSRFNLLHLHRTHIRRWPELGELLVLLRARQQSGTWVGPAIVSLIRDLEGAPIT